MKRTVVVIFAFIVLGLLGGVGYAMNAKTPLLNPVAKSATSLETGGRQRVETIGLPQELVIERLNVKATIEDVGLDREKRMDVPKNVMNTAWYNLGPKPGEKGNAVIDGHVDTPTGAPAVFYNLKKLQKGDKLHVTDAKGTAFIFEVTGIADYPTNEFPIQEVFGPTEKTRLNLITCGGVWNKAKKEYSERTVVYSELKSAQ